jgi:hypothetical protein
MQLGMIGLGKMGANILAVGLGSAGIERIHDAAGYRGWKKIWLYSRVRGGCCACNLAIVIWCKEFSVGFIAAPLSAT